QSSLALAYAAAEEHSVGGRRDRRPRRAPPLPRDAGVIDGPDLADQLEQMPGRRGLELIGEIRAIDPAMPVVMVTQSEDEGTLRDAIGIEVDDYLVKPVHPRQILSVVTRLLDGARIRQQ